LFIPKTLTCFKKWANISWEAFGAVSTWV